MVSPVTVMDEALALLDGARAIALDLAVAHATLDGDFSDEVVLAMRAERDALYLVAALAGSAAGRVEVPRRDEPRRPGEVSAALDCLLVGGSPGGSGASSGSVGSAGEGAND